MTKPTRCPYWPTPIPVKNPGPYELTPITRKPKVSR